MGLRTKLRLTRQPDGMSTWVGIAILLVGVVLILFGWLWEGTWEDVFIEVGAAAGVGGIVLLFKPRLLRQVDQRAAEAGTTAGETAAALRTEALEERVVRLEGVSGLQADALTRQRAAAERLVNAVGDSPSFPNIFELLERASAQGLFMDRFFVATSNELGRPLLEVSTDPIAPEDQLIPVGPLVYLRIFKLTLIEDEGERFLPAKGGQLIWRSEDSLLELADRLFDTCMRLNLPYDSLMLDVSFASMMLDYHLMFNARQEAEDSANRLTGKLLYAINDEWVLTDAGLEGIASDHFYGWRDHFGYGYHLDLNSDEASPSGCRPDLWEEAKYFARRLSP